MKKSAKHHVAARRELCRVLELSTAHIVGGVGAATRALPELDTSVGHSFGLERP